MTQTPVCDIVDLEDPEHANISIAEFWRHDYQSGTTIFVEIDAFKLNTELFQRKLEEIIAESPLEDNQKSWQKLIIEKDLF